MRDSKFQFVKFQTPKNLFSICLMVTSFVTTTQSLAQSETQSNIQASAQESRTQIKSPSLLKVDTLLVNSRPVNPTRKDLSELSADFILNKKVLNLNPVVGFTYAHQWPTAGNSLNSGDSEETSYFKEVKVGAIFEKGNLSTQFRSDLFLGLPSNKVDQKAGYVGSLNWDNVLTFPFQFGNIFLELMPVFYNYNRAAATETGSEYNKKISLLAGGGFSVKFLKSFSWSNSAMLYQYQNSLGNSYSIYFLKTGLSYAVADQVSVQLALATNDRVVSDRNSFEKNNTNTKLSLNWSL